MNIFDLRGSDFLLVYLAMLAVGTTVALVVRDRLRGPRTEVDLRSLDLQPLEVALLAEDDEHAVRTALAGLAQRELITLETATRTVKATGVAPGGNRLETHVHSLLGSSGRTFEDIVSRTTSIVSAARNRLTGLGLLIGGSEGLKTRLVPTIVVGAVLLVGLVKIQIGIARDRPTGLLSMLCVITGVVMFLFLTRPPKRTKRGDAALRFLRSRNMGLRQTVVAKPSRVAPDDFSLAVALYGATIIQTGPLVSLQQVLRPKPAEASSGGSSCSSCSSGSCSGGCGGGGCGGCGS
jgi:uncharacterized protein (TIGR04222 family)